MIEGGERVQTFLSAHVIEEDCFERVETLAGVDVSYRGNTASAAYILMDIGGSVLEERIVRSRPIFPYVPSFFALREFPLIYEVLKGREFDVLLVHGHGRAHPRKFGLACHTGLYFRKPTIGVAGRKLVGEWKSDFEKWTHVHYEGEVVGAVLRTHKNTNPIFVSVGHMISLQSAIELVLSNVRNHKLPEVLRLAHAISKQELKT